MTTNIHENFDAFAGIQFRDIEKSNPNCYGNDLVRTELGRLGVGTIIIPNTKAYDIESRTVMAHPTSGDRQMELGGLQEYPIKSGSLDVVRSRILTPKDIEEIVPVLNGARLRKIGASKWEQYSIASDFMPKTVAIEIDQRPESELFDSLVGDQLVVKADTSQDSKYIRVCSRSEVKTCIRAMRDEFSDWEKENNKTRGNKRVLIQEFVPGLSWSELKGIDEKSRDMLAKADSTELRMYCFVDSKNHIPFSQRYYATARVLGEGYDNWVPIDQGSVPAQSWGIADMVSDRLLEKAGVKGGYFSIDLIKGNTSTEQEERILIREINTRDPMLVEPRESVRDYDIQRRLLANAMATIAKVDGKS